MQIYAGHGTPAATCTCGTADCLGAGGFGTGVVAGAVAGGAGAVAGAGRGAGVVAGAGAFAGVGVGGAVGCANAKVLAAALLASGVAAAMCAFAGGATVFGGGGEGMDVAFGGAIAVPLLATATLLVGAPWPGVVRRLLWQCLLLGRAGLQPVRLSELGMWWPLEGWQLWLFLCLCLIHRCGQQVKPLQLHLLWGLVGKEVASAMALLWVTLLLGLQAVTVLLWHQVGCLLLATLLVQVT